MDDFTSGNGNGDFVPQRQATVEVAMSRAAQEVQAAMAVAKRFPRDQMAAFQRIKQACGRRALAEGAMYEYTRGGSKITGPSIRLAEALAQNWGNIDFGIIELEQRDGESQVMAYAWDLETNTRQVKVFAVPHERHTRQGNYALTDPRDIYEMVANNGARRLRACILGVIPGDVVDAAVDECERTLKRAAGDKPLGDRIRDMVAVFKNELNVDQAAIEALVQHKADSITESELIRLRKIYVSIRDGMSTAADHFKPQEAASELGQRLRDAQQQAKPSGTDADRVIQQAAEKARATQAQRQQTDTPATAPAAPPVAPHSTGETSPPTDAGTEGGAGSSSNDQGEPEQHRDPSGVSWPRQLPDGWRKDIRQLDDLVRARKPQSWQMAVARNKLKAHFAPRSWEMLHRDEQDELYARLLEGSFAWT